MLFIASELSGKGYIHIQNATHILCVDNSLEMKTIILLGGS
jgi:hypothetical protein